MLLGHLSAASQAHFFVLFRKLTNVHGTISFKPFRWLTSVPGMVFLFGSLLLIRPILHPAVEGAGSLPARPAGGHQDVQHPSLGLFFEPRQVHPLSSPGCSSIFTSGNPSNRSHNMTRPSALVHTFTVGTARRTSANHEHRIGLCSRQGEDTSSPGQPATSRSTSFIRSYAGLQPPHTGPST